MTDTVILDENIVQEENNTGAKRGRKPMNAETLLAGANNRVNELNAFHDFIVNTFGTDLTRAQYLQVASSAKAREWYKDTEEFRAAVDLDREKVREAEAAKAAAAALANHAAEVLVITKSLEKLVKLGVMSKSDMDKAIAAL